MSAYPGPGPARRIAAGAVIGYVLLALAVRAGLSTAGDTYLRQLARPDDVWGPSQVGLEHVVEGLRPAVVATVTGILTVGVCLLRRSSRPLFFVSATALLAAVVTVASKVALARPDPHGGITGTGGSFPSGHTVAVVVLAGLLAFLVAPRPRWWVWLIPGILGLAMAVGLVVDGAHWATDVVGGALLAVGVLAGVSGSGWNRWAGGPGRVSTRRPSPASAGPSGPA